MIVFNPKPDYKRISKYFDWGFSPEEFESQFPEGALIAIDWWQSKEQVIEIENSFKIITERYKLGLYNDDLLVLILTKYIEVEALINQAYEQYDQKVKAKELAALLLLFKSTPEDKYYKLTTASNKETVKITDSKLIDWLGTTIIASIEKGCYPLTLLGVQAETGFNEILEGKSIVSVEKLEKVVKCKIPPPLKSINQHKADLCLFLYEYLVSETPIKPESSAIFSDALLNFYFDILELLKYINRDAINSDPKDFTRSLLWYRLKPLNPSLSRK